MRAWTMRAILSLLALALSTSVSPAFAQDAQPQGPSFDCAKAATRVEVAICGDANLAAADRLMAQLYAAVRTSAFERGESNEPARQRQWLAERNDACREALAADRAQCLKSVYDDRNVELAVAALFREPELASATLQRLDPYGAPLLEAIRIFASEPPGTDWHAPALAARRALLLDLLRPFARRFAEDSDLVYGREILADEGIVTVEDALASESAFAQFLNVTSAYVEGDGPQQTFPCAAIVRHPGLIDATGPVFGSTLDNFVFVADCNATLPPAPRFAQLVDRIWDGWPTCEGTIRFAVYRGFVSDVNRALLATEADLADVSTGAMPRVRLISSAQVEAAISELAAYYVNYGRATPARSPALARAMVTQAMASAHLCD